MTNEKRAVAPVETHHYISTACLHGRHEQCRQTCKFCNAKCECRNCVHREPAVETRLTAEQFWRNVQRFPKDIIRKLAIWDCRKLDEIIIESLEAFRDKSEAERNPDRNAWEAESNLWRERAEGLREEIERLREWPIELAKVTALGVDCEPSEAADFVADLTNVAMERLSYGAQQKSRAEAAEAEVDAQVQELEIRANLISRHTNEMVALKMKHEQEAATLRERERWVSVEEKLPEIVRHFGGKDNNMYGESAKILIFNGELNIGWLYKSGTWDSVDGNKITGVTHWKLSLGPEGQ